MIIENKLNRTDRKEVRKHEAEKRQEVYDNLTPAQKLERLDIKFGKGLGATKERKKLANLIDNNQVIPKNVEKLALQNLPEEIMAEIEALNDDSSLKKKVKAKERRKQEKRNS